MILRHIDVSSSKKVPVVTLTENNLSEKEFHISSTKENQNASLEEQDYSGTSSEITVSYSSKENSPTSSNTEILSTDNGSTFTSSKDVQISPTVSNYIPSSTLSTSTLSNQNKNISYPSLVTFTPQVIGDLTPKQLALINSNSAYSGYVDRNFSKDCSTPESHEEMFEIMKFWIKFAGIHDIPFWVSFGSLIGAVRHQDMIPWDADMDISVPDQYEDIIRKFSTPRGQISKNKVNIVTRPGPHCPKNGERLDCQENAVTSQVDGCAFCGPLARLFFTDSRRADLFLFTDELRTIREDLLQFDFEFKPEKYDWYFPLRNCSFMNLVVQCPNQPETILKDRYGDYKANHECVKGKWVEIS